MCGRYAVTADPATLAEELDALDETGGAARTGYNIAPTTEIAAVVDRHDRSDGDDNAGAAVRRRIRAMRWGLVPVWAKDLKSGPLLFNARSETVATKPAFRTSYSRHRCLVPMDGWYEWRPATTGSRPAKTPYFMSHRDGERLYAAGIWSAWKDPQGAKDEGSLLSCSILTTAAVGDLAAIHDRMPLMLHAGQWDQWLDPDGGPPDALLASPGEAFAAAISIREVRPLVNSVRNDGPELLQPVPQADDSATGEGDGPALF